MGTRSNTVRVIRPSSGAESSRATPAITPSTPVITPAEVAARQPGNWPLRIIIAALMGVNLLGLPYYRLAQGDRVRSSLHLWFKPSGYVGQSAGMLALAMFLFLWLYPLRKKFRWLAFTGAVGRWLDVHVTVALALPLLIAIHASWRFEGLIGLGFASILVVCASGVIGRYLYTRIPRSRSGIELTIGEVTAERRVLLTVIATSTGLNPIEIEKSLNCGTRPYSSLGVLGTLRQMVSDDLARWRIARELRRSWSFQRGEIDRNTINKAVALASREMALTQRSRMLAATHQVFRYWHVAHRPFALAALGAVLIHVTIVLLLGVTWLW